MNSEIRPGEGPDRRIITALDFPAWGDALKLVDMLGERAGFFKVGLELFSAEGPQTVRSLRERGKKVFVDLKLFDIPRTVGRTAGRLSALGASFITVHALAGAEVMRAAAAGVRGGPGGCRTLGVTVLTSVADGEGDLGEKVLRLAVEARKAGIDGVICAVGEAGRVKAECGEDFLVVTPGIRMRALEGDDQKRFATPREAMREGADFIVVGRPITASSDPGKAFAEICASMLEAGPPRS